MSNHVLNDFLPKFLQELKSIARELRSIANHIHYWGESFESLDRLHRRENEALADRITAVEQAQKSTGEGLADGEDQDFITFD